MQIVVATTLWVLTAAVLLSCWYLVRTFRGLAVDEGARAAFLRSLALCAVPLAILAATMVATHGEPVDVGRPTIAANALACGLGCVLTVALPLLQEHRRRQHQIRMMLDRDISVG